MSRNSFSRISLETIFTTLLWTWKPEHTLSLSQTSHTWIWTCLYTQSLLFLTFQFLLFSRLPAVRSWCHHWPLHFFCPHKQLSNPSDCSLGISLECVPSLPSSAWLPEDCLDCYSIWFPTGFCSQRYSTWFPTGFCSQHLPDPAYSTHSDLAGGPKTPLWLCHYIFSRRLIAPFCLQG